MRYGMSKKCILVADDDREILEILDILLRGEGYEVIAAKDGMEALAAASPKVDLYILDVNMPRLSGFTTAMKLREEYNTPIIFLTAYSAETDKVKGFGVGADDYISKPFSNIELLMRIKAILRRSVPIQANKKESKYIESHDIKLDLDRNLVIKNGELIYLTYTEFNILKLLLTNKNKIFSLDNIYNSIWGEEAVGDAAIMVHIKNIRKKLGDSSKNPKYIKTAWGRGYYAE